MLHRGLCVWLLYAHWSFQNKSCTRLTFHLQLRLSQKSGTRWLSLQGMTPFSGMFFGLTLIHTGAVEDLCLSHCLQFIRNQRSFKQFWQRKENSLFICLLLPSSCWKQILIYSARSPQGKVIRVKNKKHEMLIWYYIKVVKHDWQLRFRSIPLPHRQINQSADSGYSDHTQDHLASCLSRCRCVNKWSGVDWNLWVPKPLSRTSTCCRSHG